VSSTSFEILGRDGAGRLGRFKTKHGVVQTPTLLPVINPNLNFIPPSEMRKFGAEMLITNSYIIWKRHREQALAEGVHKLIGWDGPLMTDSGTFQMYMYGSVEVQPQEIVAFERDIGVDVGTILDIFSTPDRTHDQARTDLQETLVRARASAQIKGDMALACTVQGGIYPDLRAECAKAYQGMGADFYPIGGVVPIMEQQRYATLVDVIVAAKQNLDPSKPVHLFGAGHPLVFPLAALLGCDFFDSAAYAKYAKDGRMIFPDGTWRLEEITESWCACPVCSKHTPAELKKLPAQERELRLAEHNLWVTFAELKHVREAMRQGTLWELAERRCRAHPTLAEAFKRIVAHSEWIETQEPLSKGSAFFHLSPESSHRPEVRRYRERLLSRFDPKGRDFLLLPEVNKPYSMSYAPLLDRLARLPVVPAVQSAFGPVPLVLDEMYPLAQSDVPATLDKETREDLEAYLGTIETAKGVRVRADLTLEEAERLLTPLETPIDWDLERVRAVADYQFGEGAGDALLAGKVEIQKSRNTGKIRQVFVDGERVLALRAEDGFFVPQAAGAKRLHAAIPAPRLRVVVEQDSVAFNREGKNVFAKFVRSADPALRARDEVLVVDENDTLVAVGQLLLTPHEMGWFKTGMAVSVREGIKG